MRYPILHMVCLVVPLCVAGTAHARIGTPPRSGSYPLRGVDEIDHVRMDVTVVAGGYEHEGVRYRSLSALANALTGSHLNGRHFFGLTKRKAT